jgi:hypothetical protein
VTAKRRKKHRPTLAELPPAWSRKEAHPFLAKKKEQILRTLDSRYLSIGEQVRFAVFLIATGRTREALQIVDYANRSVPRDYGADQWHAASTACCVANYLRRKSGQSGKATKDFKRFVESPSSAVFIQTDTWTSKFFRWHLADERFNHKQYYNYEDPSRAIGARAGWIVTLMEFREYPFHGYPKKGKVSISQIDRWIKKAFEELTDRLDREAARDPA